MSTDLHRAAQSGDLTQLRQLLAAGAEVDGREHEPLKNIPSVLLDEGETQVLAAGFSFCRSPLMLAARNGHRACVEHLLGAGADPQLKDAAGLTAFLLACRHGHLETAQMLLGAGADPKQKPPDKRTALHQASQAGHLQVVCWLLEAGLPINLQDREGATPLLIASTLGHLEMIEVLLAQGADPELANKEGLTPLTALLSACRRQRIPETEAFGGGYLAVQWTGSGVFAQVPLGEAHIRPMVETLLEAGAQVNPPSRFTPLAVAAQFGYPDLVRLLLARGANPNAPSVTGPTPLEVARMMKREAVVALLESVTSPSNPEKQPDPEPREEGELPLPDFTQAPPSFGEQLEQLRIRLGNARLQPYEGYAGVVELLFTPALQMGLEELQSEYLDKGIFLFQPGSFSPSPSRLLALPTADPFQSLLVMGTQGVNCEVTVAQLIDWLKQLEKKQPFRLLAVGHDLIEGRFLTPLQEVETLAEEMAAICPDIVDQGTLTVEELAEELLQSQRLFLWWD